MPLPKPVPLGKPLQLSDDQLDELATITPTDIEKAAVFWRNNAPADFETLLDAQLVDEEESKP